MFLFVFSIILFILNIICFVKKKYLYLFIPCMLFLPAYYGFEFNSTFPILTITRIMFLIFYLYAFINKRRNLSFSIKNIHSISVPYKLLIGYFVLRLISNLYYVTTYGQAAKTFFLIIFEQLLFLIAIYILAPTRNELNTVVKIVIWVASLLFLIGIFESYTYTRPFDALYTVSRHVMNEHYVRLGFLRATTTFGMPGMYANMCVMILPLILYMYRKEMHKRYLFSAGLCFLAIIHAGSRSDLLYLIPILGIYFIYVLREKHDRLIFLKNLLAVLASVFIFIVAVSVIYPSARYYYSGTGKSLLNEVGFHFDLSEDAPEGSKGYGANSMRGSISRTQQFTGLIYTSRINPFFGLGSGAQVRGDVQYYWCKKWRVVKSYDLGIVEIYCDEGAVGLLGILLLLSYFAFLSRKKPAFQLLLVTYILTTLNTVNMFSYLFFYLTIIYISNTTEKE